MLILPGCSEDRSQRSSPSDQTEGEMELSEDSTAPGAPTAQMESKKDEAFSRERNAQEEDGTGRNENQQLSVLPLSVSKLAEDRMLEYTVNLGFRSDSILKSRETTFAVAEKYGFLSNSRTYTSGEQSFRATIRVSADRLYDALKELEAAGLLYESSIDVTDHTSDMVWQGIKLDREKLRSIRRQALQNRTNANNQIQAENLISQSEDGQDQARFERWKIEDRVKWATVSIYVSGPEAVSQLEVPTYQNALISLTNSFLSLTYWLLENLILVIILAILIWKRKWIWNGITRMGGKDS